LHQSRPNFHLIVLRAERKIKSPAESFAEILPETLFCSRRCCRNPAFADLKSYRANLVNDRQGRQEVIHQFARNRGRTYVLACDTSELLTESQERSTMQVVSMCDWRRALSVAGLLLVVSLQLIPLTARAQNLGQQPATGQAVQGQTAAQPEGAVLNLVNWIGNVIAPVGAALAVVMAVISYSQGRGVARWAVTAGGLLVVSGLTRLIEFWIANGTQGIQ